MMYTHVPVVLLLVHLFIAFTSARNTVLAPSADDELSSQSKKSPLSSSKTNADDLPPPISYDQLMQQEQEQEQEEGQLAHLQKVVQDRVDQVIDENYIEQEFERLLNELTQPVVSRSESCPDSGPPSHTETLSNWYFKDLDILHSVLDRQARQHQLQHDNLPGDMFPPLPSNSGSSVVSEDEDEKADDYSDISTRTGGDVEPGHVVFDENTPLNQHLNSLAVEQQLQAQEQQRQKQEQQRQKQEQQRQQYEQQYLQYLQQLQQEPRQQLQEPLQRIDEHDMPSGERDEDVDTRVMYDMEGGMFCGPLQRGEGSVCSDLVEDQVALRDVFPHLSVELRRHAIPMFLVAILLALYPTADLVEGVTGFDADIVRVFSAWSSIICAVGTSVWLQLARMYFQRR